jgi:hypothetical protein
VSALPASERAKLRFVHLNHTNPALDPTSEAWAAVRAAGARVAIEGVSGVLDLLLTEPASEAELLVQEATEAFVRYLEPWMEGAVTSDAPAPPPAGR